MEKDVLQKLRYKDGQATVLNAPVGYQFGLEDGSEGKYDFILLFVQNSDGLNHWLPKVMAILNEDAVFWICYPKQAAKIETNLNRDILATIVRDQTPFRAVSNVAIDDKWSALRFRQEAKVKTKK